LNNLQIVQKLLSRPIAYQSIFAEIVGSVSGGIFLSQLYYWSNGNKGRDPNGFIYKTFDDWHQETFISRREWEVARKSLKKLGLLTEEQRGLDRQLWYKLDIELLYQTIADTALKSSNIPNVRCDVSKSHILRQQASDVTLASVISDARSIYTENTNQKILTKNTHTDPDARAGESFGEKFEPEPTIQESLASTEVLASTEIEETIREPLASTEPITQSLEVSPVSGEGEFSGGCDKTRHQTTQKFNDSWNYSGNITPITDELVRLYNNGRPDNWTGVKKANSTLRKKIKYLVDRYQSNGESIEKLTEDWKNALLWYRGSDFHTKKEFGSGDIYWLCESERVEVAAAKWEGSGESVKEKLAQKIVEQSNGRPEWRSDRLRTGANIGRYIDLLKKLVTLPGHPDCPPIEWIQINYPEVFN
jgi:hypothetical protein